MLKGFSIFILCAFFFSCDPMKDKTNPLVVIHTKFGKIKVELYQQQAPVTVKAFLAYVDAGHYKNTSFYRVMREDNQDTGVPKSRLIQGGLWQAKNALYKTIAPIAHESSQTSKIQHKRGVISMARMEPGTATSEFFICTENQPGFDYGGNNNQDGQGYAGFGKVVEGWDILDRINEQPERQQKFKPYVTILDIKRVDK